MHEFTCCTVLPVLQGLHQVALGGGEHRGGGGRGCGRVGGLAMGKGGSQERGGEGKGSAWIYMRGLHQVALWQGRVGVDTRHVQGA